MASMEGYYNRAAPSIQATVPCPFYRELYRRDRGTTIKVPVNYRVYRGRVEAKVTRVMGQGDYGVGST